MGKQNTADAVRELRYLPKTSSYGFLRDPQNFWDGPGCFPDMLGFQADVKGQFGCKFDHRLWSRDVESKNPLDWNGTHYSGSTHPMIKKVEHLPIKENALCSLPFLKGLILDHNANIEHLFNLPNFRNYLMPFTGQAHFSWLLISARKLAKRKWKGKD